MRTANQLNLSLYTTPGTVVLWRWLGFDRFFPPGVSFHRKLRGCATVSDHQYRFMPFTHTYCRTIKKVVWCLPEIQIMLGDILSIIASFKVLSSYQFTDTPSPQLKVYQSPTHDPILLFSSKEILLVNITHFKPRKIPQFSSQESIGQNQDGLTTEEARKLESLGWRLRFPDLQYSRTESGGEEVRGMTMGMDGRILIGVGSKGTICIWGVT